MTAPNAMTLIAACETLSAADPALARAYDDIGVPDWRSAAPSYAMLARMIAYQQLSTKAAGTIWGRVCERYGEDLPPTAILTADDGDLRACGLSRPKVCYLNTIAEAVVTGTLCFDRLCAAPLDEARKELTAVKGIGPWTAELFLLYAVGATDAFPPGDVGLMEAHRMLSDQKRRMEAAAFTAHAERWRPYRGVATHLLWGWINAERAKTGGDSPQA
jgi:DNA-3-methyladenine glycosylase II